MIGALDLVLALVVILGVAWLVGVVCARRERRHVWGELESSDVAHAMRRRRRRR